MLGSFEVRADDGVLADGPGARLRAQPDTKLRFGLDCDGSRGSASGAGDDGGERSGMALVLGCDLGRDLQRLLHSVIWDDPPPLGGRRAAGQGHGGPPDRGPARGGARRSAGRPRGGARRSRGSCRAELGQLRGDLCLATLLIPLLARSHSWSALAAGQMVGAQALGGGTVFAWVLVRNTSRKPGVALSAGVLLAGAGTAALAVAGSPLLACAATALVGVGLGLFGTHVAPLVLAANARTLPIAGPSSAHLGPDTASYPRTEPRRGAHPPRGRPRHAARGGRRRVHSGRIGNRQQVGTRCFDQPFARQHPPVTSSYAESGRGGQRPRRRRRGQRLRSVSAFGERGEPVVKKVPDDKTLR